MTSNSSILRAHYEFSMWTKFGRHDDHLLFSTCNPGILGYLTSLTKDSRDVVTISVRYGVYYDLPQFFPYKKDRQDWGFGKVLTEITEQKPEWTTWAIPLHTARGRNEKNNETRIAAITATLWLIAKAITLHQDFPSQDRRNQIFNLTFWGWLETTPNNQHYACSSEYEILSPTLNWISNVILNSAIPAIQTTLASVHKILVGEENSKYIEPSDFAIVLNPDQIIITIMDYMGISLDGYKESPLDETLILTSHNSFGPLYQLLMLVAMAKLHDLARLQGGV